MKTAPSRGRFRVRKVRYLANLQFFGIGSGAGDRGQSIDINQKGPFLVSKFLVQVAENFYIGPQFRYIEVDTSLQNPILPPDLNLPPQISIPDTFEAVTSGIGVVLEVDTRDNRFFAQQGSYLKGTTNFARDWIGSDRNYEQFEIGYNIYRPLGENGFIAWRATGCFREGSVPFWDLCMFGGEEDAIRGYVGGQYRDKVSLTTQLEYRLRLSGKWGAVAFAGVGQVAPQVGDFKLDDLLPSVGVGIRFMASEEERVNLSIDYAKGQDSDAWYFRIGEAF
jgi:outer membrane protein assembly factor BamA